MPILPPPPPLFSTMTEPPIASCIAAAMMRAMMSDGPPGVLATTIQMGRSGYAAKAGAMRRTARAAHRPVHSRRHAAGDDVGRSARRVGDDDPDGPVGIGGKSGADAQDGRRR